MAYSVSEGEIMKTTSTETITIREDFMPVETKTLDSKNRVSLGEKIKKKFLQRMKVDSFQIYIGNEGDILLRPTVRIPSRELWLHQNPDALLKLRKGLDDLKQGRVKKISDLDRFLESL